MENYPLYDGRIYNVEKFQYNEFFEKWHVESYILRLLDIKLPPDFVFKIEELIPKGQIAIGRDSVFCLNENGRPIPLEGGQNSSFSAEKRKFVKLASTGKGYIGLTEKGTVVIETPKRGFYDFCDLDCYDNVKDITACEGHMAILFEDGRVRCFDIPGWWESPDHASKVFEWFFIKQVAMGYYNVMGLKDDGTVLYHSENPNTNTHYYDHCRNVIQIDCTSVYYGNDYSAVLHADGTVTSDSFEGVKEWRDIIQIAVNEWFIAGLKRDGTVVAIEDGKDVSDQIDWTDVVNIECKFFLLVGITQDGHVKSMLLTR